MYFIFLSNGGAPNVARPGKTSPFLLTVMCSGLELYSIVIIFVTGLGLDSNCSHSDSDSDSNLANLYP